MTEERNTIPGILKDDDLPDTDQEQDATGQPTVDPVMAELIEAAQAAIETQMPEGEPQEDERHGFKYLLKDVLSVVLSAVLIAAVLKVFVVDSRSVPTGSMIPTINVGDRVLILKLPYFFKKTPERLDVVVFAPPAEFTKKDDLLKRVIGLPGDTVEVINDLVYVNGEALDEPYIAEPPNKEFKKVTVPEGHYFMMGDNRNNSNDSRGWNEPYVPIEDIKGKVLLCYWPISHWGTIE